jgi:hypothetical protein
MGRSIAIKFKPKMKEYHRAHTVVEMVLTGVDEDLIAISLF